MKLPFEDWTIKKQFSRNVSKLFDEAFICYKNAAYRASLLFSYIAFLTIIKEIIIKSARPLAIPEGRWENLIRKLQSDGTWEKTVYEELINNTSPIFNMDEDIRQQVKYWKDRRNDCAHFKRNEIESHHTESFWSFVKSNLLKITIEGGKQSLLNKFEKHFDRTFTPPNSDFSSIIREIEESVELSELSAFWQELIDRIDAYDWMYLYDSDSAKVINRVFELCSDEIIESLVDFLKEKKYDLNIISHYPDKVNRFNYSPEEIREIWQTRIWGFGLGTFTIYSTLLRNSLIPLKEIKEANLHVIDKATDSRPYDRAVHLALAANGFGDTLFEKAFLEDRLNDWFHWVNPRADLLAYYIEEYPLRIETVEIICEMYTRSRYSHWLGERLERIFNQNSDKKNEFHFIANSNKFTIPTDLK